MEAHLKGQIMDAIERKYIAELDDEKFGFANITAKVLLAHIVKKYDPSHGILPNQFSTYGH